MPDRTETKKMLKEIIGNLIEKRELLAYTTNNRIKQDLKRVQVERNLVNREAEVSLRVCEAKDDNGKLMYPNESMRKAEITALLASDQTFEKGLKTMDARKRRINNLRLEEALLGAQIKQQETLEKLYLIDMENAL